jgi:TPR repeat protein
MKRAADLDLLAAQIEYAIMLFNGDGVEKDETAAARLFLKAARSGNPLAANRLARLYASGRGVNKDMVEAMKWHLSARNAGLKDEWLESHLTSLSPAERKALEAALKHQTGFGG